MQNQKIIYALAALILIAGGATFYWVIARDSDPSDTQRGTLVTSDAGSVGVDVTGGNATVEEVQEGEVPPAPKYRSPLAFSASVEADTRLVLQRDLGEIIAALDKNKTDVGAWVRLGIIRKIADDYRGAEEVWLYAKALAPSYTVPTDNLGDLYMNFIKDYRKAEVNLQLSIKNDPHDINAYQHLFSLYTVYGYKGQISASALIEQGLKDNPGNQTLLQLRSQLNSQ